MVEEKKNISQKSQMKSIRYLINSVSELRDSLLAINLIFGKSESVNDFFELEQNTRFDIIPLPDTMSRFLLCMDVPRNLLGHADDKVSQKLDYSNYNLQENKFLIEYKDKKATLSFTINTLLELNIAFHQVYEAINNIDDRKLMNKILRSLIVQMKSRTNKQDNNLFQIIIPDVPTEQLEIIKNKIESANLIPSNTPI